MRIIQCPITNNDYRVDDESALRAKVDEALGVYDEYMKNKGGEAEGAPEKKEEAEETKA